MIINGGVKPSHMTSTEAISSKTALNHKHQNSNPIDNVPFASLINEVDMMSHSNIEMNNAFMTIDRIGMFLSTPSQSEYNFHLEKSILREGFFS